MTKIRVTLERTIGILAFIALCSPQAGAEGSGSAVRSPKGIYVIFGPASELTKGDLAAPANSGCNFTGPSSSPPSADENIINNACAFISNPAVSGLLVVVGWDFLDPPSGFSGDLKSGSDCIRSMSSTVGLIVGMSVADATNAANIRPGTTIREIPGTATCEVQLTTNVTGSGIGDSLTVGADDMQYLDEVFSTVGSYNAKHNLTVNDPQYKTIQMGVKPGFSTPSWFFTSKGVTTCDYLFAGPQLQPGPDCDYTNIFLTAEGSPLAKPFPLPWSSRYKAAWEKFLDVIATRYGSNPLLVTVQVTGPTADSEEMIVPNSNNNPAILTLAEDVIETLEEAPGIPPLGPVPVSPLSAWSSLIANHYGSNSPYNNTDQAFIDAWEDAIDLFGRQFRDTTLSVTTGSGLPDFSGAYALPPAFPGVCAAVGDPYVSTSDCAAEWTILQYFAQPGVGGHNAKATQMDALSAEVGTTYRHKMLSAETANNLPLPGTGYAKSSQMLAGLQEGWSPVANPATVGCPVYWPALPSGCAIFATGNIPLACAPVIPDAPGQSCLAPGVTTASLNKNPITIGKSLYINPDLLASAEQGLYDVLLIAFTNTAVADVYGALPADYPPDNVPTISPLNYLQVWPQDISYAVAHASQRVQIVAQPGATINDPVRILGGIVTKPIGVQEELKLASEELLHDTAERVLPILPRLPVQPPPPPPPVIPPPCPSCPQ
jgi:hypothetical protein